MILYVDITDNALQFSLSDSTNVNPLSLPFFAGDGGLTLQIYLRQLLQTTQPSQNNFVTVNTAGLTLFAQLDSGSYNGTIYTSQATWVNDPNDTYFLGSFPMNTAAMMDLIGNGTSATAVLRIGFFDEGEPTTVFAQTVNILPGIPTMPLVVPAGLTPLSVQAANGMFVPQNGGNNGQGFSLISPLGKKLFLQAVDNGDGTASFGASPSN
jgi:hypothetical protein